MNNSKKIVLTILALLLTVPPFFDGGQGFLIREMIFIFPALALILFVSESSISAKSLKKNLCQPVFLLLSLFLLFGFVLIFFSTSPYKSAIVWLEFLGGTILFLIAAFFYLGKKEIDFLIKIFLAVSGLLCLIGVYFYIVGSYSRLTSLFWWSNPFAGYLLFALFLGIDWVLFRPSGSAIRRPRGSEFGSEFVRFIFLALTITAFILTGSRGAFLSFLIVLPVYFYFKYIQLAGARNYKSPQPPLLKGVEFNPPRPPLEGGSAKSPPCKGGYGGFMGWAKKIIVVFFVSLFLVIVINSFKNDSFSFISHIKESGTQSDFSSSIRLNYWRGAWGMFKDRPLAGWGAGTFGTIYHLYQKNPISAGKYAHNWYLEMLAEQGIFATIFFVLFLASVLFIFLNPLTSPLYPAAAGGTQKPPYFPLYKGDAIRPPLQRGDRGVYSLDKMGYALPFFVGILASILHNGVDIDWHFGANAIIFWIFLGLLYNVSRESKPPLLAKERLHRKRSAERDGVRWDGVMPPPLILPREHLGERVKKTLLFFSIILILSGIILLHGGYFYEQGLKFKEANNLPEAEVAFKKSVFLNPNPDFLRELGIILYSRAINVGGAEGQALLNQALKISKKIIKYDSYNSLNNELAGRIYLAQGKFSEAENEFKEAIRFNKFNPRHYINFASLLISKGEKEEAKNLINKILSYYPEEVVNNKKMYIMSNQEITSGIEKDIEYLRYLSGIIK